MTLAPGLLLLALSAAPPDDGRLRLVSATLTPAPQGEGRFRLQARFAPAETAGERRKSPRFTAVGRLAKAGAACEPDEDIFRDGFED